MNFNKCTILVVRLWGILKGTKLAKHSNKAAESRKRNPIGPHFSDVASPNIFLQNQSSLKPNPPRSSPSFHCSHFSMAATIAAMAMKFPNPTKPITTPISKPTPLLSLQNLPKGLTKPTQDAKLSTSIAGTAIAGAIFSTLGSSDAAFAAQQIADIAEGDNRGLALLLPIIPAIGWVLFNILQPALNQLNRMRSSKGVIIGLGLGGLAASGLLGLAPDASASEVAAIAEAASDNRGQLLLFVVAPAIVWVLYNILQPALNQINRMRS
ncbi:hypothetical protein RJT34_03396 [Clitoria ternatea]|uniref:Uncharacterized protein n=1 Tax=Clitoria ternatea TaxID=43366 RepID=A0AAN9KJC9_CLITE